MTSTTPNQARILLLWIAFVALTLPSFAQIDTNEVVIDTMEVDTTMQINPDTVLIDDPNTVAPPEDDEDFGLPQDTGFFSTRNGGYLGATVEFTDLDPHTLDPDLDGDMVIYGGQGYVILSGWTIGGGGVGAKLFDLSPKYDEFTFGYSGMIVGYDQLIFQKLFSLRPALLIGGGGLNMIKKRPDLPVSNGEEILERFRTENFFCFRPSLSLGFSPIDVLEFRANVAYLLPIGGASVSDLRSLSYGLHVMLGVMW